MGPSDDVSGDDGDGAELAHGAGIRQNHAVEESPVDFGEERERGGEGKRERKRGKKE